MIHPSLPTIAVATAVALFVFLLRRPGWEVRHFIPGMATILTGCASNWLVMAVNGGKMPVVGVELPPELLFWKTADSGCHLLLLSDRIPITFQNSQAILSVGDLLLVVGGLWITVELIRPLIVKYHQEYVSKRWS